jgi:hypothetical protein
MNFFASMRDQFQTVTSKGKTGDLLNEFTSFLVKHSLQLSQCSNITYLRNFPFSGCVNVSLGRDLKMQVLHNSGLSLIGFSERCTSISCFCGVNLFFYRTYEFQVTFVTPCERYEVQ